jgi:hypothetical protein
MQLDVAPNFCYKYLESKVHAERMLEGYVWLSTVVDIRTCDRTRADAGELTLQYGLNGFNNKNTDKATNITRKNLAEMGINILPGGEFSGSGRNVKVVRNHPNAFLFCTTESKPTKKLARLFGSNCVGINDPERFWLEVTTELKKNRILSCRRNTEGLSMLINEMLNMVMEWNTVRSFIPARSKTKMRKK